MSGFPSRKPQASNLLAPQINTDERRWVWLGIDCERSGEAGPEALRSRRSAGGGVRVSVKREATTDPDGIGTDRRERHEEARRGDIEKKGLIADG